MLTVKDLTVGYRAKGGLVRAVDSVGFNLDRGQLLGLVGESGCGKSTVALALMGLQDGNALVKGNVVLSGRRIPLGLIRNGFSWREVRGKMLAYVPQDPHTGLNPMMRVGFQVEEAVLAHRSLSRRQARDEALNMLKKVNISAPERAYRSYPHQLSGGQRQRVLLAMAMAQRPQVLLADEPTTALDVTTQAQILGEIRGLALEAGSSVILITHDLGVAAGLVHHVAVMYAGRLVEVGPAADVLNSPAHPYTVALLNSFPRLGCKDRLSPVPGQPPSLLALPPGCAFHPRCPSAEVLCRRLIPPLRPFGGSRAVACSRLGPAPRDNPAGEADGDRQTGFREDKRREVLPA